MHLIGSLGWLAYVRFGVWMAIGLALYALYGVHGAEQREREHARWAVGSRVFCPPALCAGLCCGELFNWHAPPATCMPQGWSRCLAALFGCSELEEARARESNGAGSPLPRRLTSLDHEGLMGSIELPRAGYQLEIEQQQDEAPAVVSALARLAGRYGGSDRARLMAGRLDSSYDPGED